MSTKNRIPRRCSARRERSSGSVSLRPVDRITLTVAGELALGVGPGSTYSYTTRTPPISSHSHRTHLRAALNHLAPAEDTVSARLADTH